MYKYKEEEKKLIDLVIDEETTITATMNRVFREKTKKDDIFQYANDVLEYKPNKKESDSYKQIINEYSDSLKEIEEEEIEEFVEDHDDSGIGIIDSTSIKDLNETDEVSGALETEIKNKPKDHILLSLPPLIIKMVDRYLDDNPEIIKSTMFTDPEKVPKKGSIIFLRGDSEELVRSSMYVKLAVFVYGSNLKPDTDVCKQMLSQLLAKLKSNDILDNLYKIITTKIYSTMDLNQPMWTFLKYSTGHSPDVYSIIIMNNIIETVFPSIRLGSNPVSYLVSVIKSQLQYLFMINNPDPVIYSDVVYNDVENKELSGNQTSIIAMRHTIETSILRNVIDKKREYIKKTKSIKNLSPILRYITVPFICRLMNIKYNDMLQLNAVQIQLLGVWLSEIISVKAPGLFILSALLKCYSRTKVRRNTLSKNLQEKLEVDDMINSMDIDEEFKEFVKENGLIEELFNEILSPVYVDIISGNNIKITDKKVLYREIATFYKLLYNGDFDETIDGLKEQNFEFV